MKKVKQPHGGEIYILEKGETANPNGRPRKLVSHVIADLRAQGIENVKPTNVIDLLETLMNCDNKKLIELANDENNWLVQQTAKYMIKNPEKAWNEVQDRAHGKPTQKQEIQLDNNVIRVTLTGEVPKIEPTEPEGESA